MKKILWVFVVAAVFASCRKLPDLDTLTYNAIVVTNHDPSLDWSDYHTYYLPPVVGEIGDDPLDSTLDQTKANTILDAIRQNLNDRGYTEEPNKLLADIGVSVVAITTTHIQTYYPGYWWGYGGYYPYYPYYPYSYTYSYSTGSLVIDLLDLKNANIAANKVNIMWTNFDNGVLGLSTTTNLAVDAVNQAFVQSPYILHSH